LRAGFLLLERGKRRNLFKKKKGPGPGPSGPKRKNNTFGDKAKREIVKNERELHPTASRQPARKRRTRPASPLWSEGRNS